MKAQEVIAAFIAVFIAIIVFLASIIFSFNPYTASVPQPSPAINSDQVVLQAACAEQSGTELQTCCESWAEQSGAVRVRCLGEWELTEEQQCSWQCSTQPLE